MSPRRLLIIAATAAGLFGAVNGFSLGHDGAQAEASCKGRVAVVELPRSRYPGIVSHIEYSWTQGYSRVLQVHRAGAKQRRDRLLGWWEARHPQPKGDGLDLDESPAAALRASWKADVRPIDEHENRAAGAKLGAELRGLRDGQCVKYDFGGA